MKDGIEIVLGDHEILFRKGISFLLIFLIKFFI